jgi:hypothetical protein
MLVMNKGLLCVRHNSPFCGRVLTNAPVIKSAVATLALRIIRAAGPHRSAEDCISTHTVSLDVRLGYVNPPPTMPLRNRQWLDREAVVVRAPLVVPGRVLCTQPIEVFLGCALADVFPWGLQWADVNAKRVRVSSVVDNVPRQVAAGVLLFLATDSP